MIYGVHASGNFDLNTYEKFKYSHCWSTSVQKDLGYTDYFVGFAYDNSLPLKDDDFFFRESTGFVLFSGHIYNHKELCTHLGIRMQELKDPRLVWMLYQKEGIYFINSLNGDFSFFINDETSDISYLARDHIGVAPFSYCIYNDNLWFSSDPVALSRSLFRNGRLNSELLLKEFRFADITGAICPSVQNVPAGSYLKFIKNPKAEIIRYWHPEKIKKDKNVDFNTALTELKNIVSDSVTIRCDPGYTAASHFSGGLDSMVVASMARKIYGFQNTFYGFSWSPDESIVCMADDRSADERYLIYKTAGYCNIHPVLSRISSEDYLNYFSDPLKHGFYFHERKVTEEAGKRSVNLIFSGFGGDEFISYHSYGIYVDLIRSFKFKKYWKRFSDENPKYFLYNLYACIFNPLTGLVPFHIWHQNRKAARYLKRPFKSNRKATLKFYIPGSRQKSHLAVLDYQYHSNRTGEWYLSGMKSGIEYRYPLLDKRIIEFILKLPSELMVMDKYSRIFLREIAKDHVPEDLRWTDSKDDPSMKPMLNDIFTRCVEEFRNEIQDFKSNKDLYFVDFRKLESEMNDPQKYKKYKSVIDETLFNLKYMHEYTRSYRA